MKPYIINGALGHEEILLWYKKSIELKHILKLIYNDLL